MTSLWITTVFNRRKEKKPAIRLLQSVDSFAVLNLDWGIKRKSGIVNKVEVPFKNEKRKCDFLSLENKISGA